MDFVRPNCHLLDGDSDLQKGDRYRKAHRIVARRWHDAGAKRSIVGRWAAGLSRSLVGLLQTGPILRRLAGSCILVGSCFSCRFTLPSDVPHTDSP